MAWGDKGVLFVGSFDAGAVYAVTEQAGRRVVKTILTGLSMPTGLAFRDGALYVAAVNRILRYDGAEENLDRMPQPKIVYDDLPSSRHHGWKYLTLDKEGRLTFGVGAPCNICDLPTGTGEVRRLDPQMPASPRNASARESRYSPLRPPLPAAPSPSVTPVSPPERISAGRARKVGPRARSGQPSATAMPSWISETE